MTRSATASTSCRMWVDSRMVRLAAISRMVRRTSRIWLGFEPLVGSSMMRTSGSWQQHLGHADTLAIAFGELADALFDHRLQRAAVYHLLDSGFQARAGEPARRAEEAQKGERGQSLDREDRFPEIAETFCRADASLTTSNPATLALPALGAR